MEKYRPLVLDDVVGNTETIERLKVIAKDGNCPHIIISVLFSNSCMVELHLNCGAGDAWHWKDDKYSLSRSPNAWRCVQRGRARAQCLG